MVVESVNVGLPAPRRPRGPARVTTGIVQGAGGRPRHGAGHQPRRRPPGRPPRARRADKAVYALPGRALPALARDARPAELGAAAGSARTSPPRGVLEDEALDRRRLPGRVGALLEVSQPRVPCSKLAMKAGDPAFGRPFLASGSSRLLPARARGGRGAATATPSCASAPARAASACGASPLLVDATPDDLDAAAALPDLPLGWRTRFAKRAVAMRRRPASSS